MATKAWFKIINPESNWTKVWLERIEDVDDLKEAIKNKMAPELDAYPTARLTIRAKQGKDDDDANAKELDATDEVTSALPKYGIWLLVSAPSAGASSEPFTEGHPSKKRKVDEVDHYFETFVGCASHVGKPSNFCEIQKDTVKVHCNRPFELTNIPLALIHPVFGQYRDSAKTITPSAQDNSANLSLTWLMVQFYKNEKQREGAVHDFFFKHYNIQLHHGPINGTSSESDGHAFANPNLRPYIHLLLEVKNELTGNSSDPYLQASVLYKEYLEKLDRKVLLSSVCPVMLTLIFGCYMQIVGMVFTKDGVQVESMGNAFAFFSDRYDQDHRLAATRSLASLRQSLTTLEEYYRSLKIEGSSTAQTIQGSSAEQTIQGSSATDGYPYVTSFKTPEGKKVNFKYILRPFDNRLIFLAEVELKATIVIKFCQSYSLEAHRLLSDEGFAPKLLGHESIAGGWYMVVMQSVHTTHDLLSSLRTDQRGKYQEGMKSIVSFLHEKNFVHGDLRASNVLVPKEENNNNILLIDFDGAGQADQVVYLPNLNCIDITRPVDAVDGAPITKDHDNFMLEQMFRSQDSRETCSRLIVAPNEQDGTMRSKRHWT